MTTPDTKTAPPAEDALGFFMYSPQGGFEVFPSEAEAVEGAQIEIDNYKEWCPEEWPAEVADIRVGRLVVTHSVALIPTRPDRSNHDAVLLPRP